MGYKDNSARYSKQALATMKVYELQTVLPVSYGRKYVRTRVEKQYAHAPEANWNWHREQRQ